MTQTPDDHAILEAWRKMETPMMERKTQVDEAIAECASDN